MSAIVIGSVAVVAIAVLLPMGLHRVDEGHIGVYWRGGALLSSITGTYNLVLLNYIVEHCQ